MDHPQSRVSNFHLTLGLSLKGINIAKWKYAELQRNPIGKTLTWPELLLWILPPFGPEVQLRVLEARGMSTELGEGDFTFWIWSLLLGPWAYAAATLGVELLVLKASPLITQTCSRSIDQLWSCSKKQSKKGGRNLSTGSWELQLSWGYYPWSLPELCCNHARARPCTMLIQILTMPRGLDVPAWRLSCLITMDLSGSVDWTWLLVLDLHWSLCSGTMGLLFLSVTSLSAPFAVLLSSHLLDPCWSACPCCSQTLTGFPGVLLSTFAASRVHSI